MNIAVGWQLKPADCADLLDSKRDYRSRAGDIYGLDRAVGDEVSGPSLRYQRARAMLLCYVATRI